MSHVTKKLAWLTALMLPGIAAAQTRSSLALATMNVGQATLILSKNADLHFPDAFPGQGALHNDAPAIWSVSTTQGVTLSISFTLPTALSGPGATIPLTYGTTSATHFLTGSGVTFDPSTGATVMGSNSSGSVYLGYNAGTTDPFVTATVGTVPAGTYSATIVLTIAVL